MIMRWLMLKKISHSQPNIDICKECGEHAEFEDTDDGCVSTCCGASPYDTDPDVDMER